MSLVKIHIPTIENRLKHLKKFDNIVFAVANRLNLLILQNWGSSKGADDRKFKELKEPYRTNKAKGKVKDKPARQGVRNLLLSGNMTQDLGPVNQREFVWVLKFKSAQERKKASGNFAHAPNMLVPVSDRIDAKLQKLAFKLWTRP